MPYIKKIELKGFKSFGPKTTKITLDKGFTAITGPNGSGKTNIADAVLFGLGELSSRRLRAANLSKLIFHGSPVTNVAKAKLAKVVIQFDNSDHHLPVDTNTVTVSREVYSEGQSVYRLNGRRISRSHILDVLSIAGISLTGHNMIAQGRITRMAELSSHERRRTLSTLVGIAQYDAEKAEAENKLRTAEISLRTAMGRIDEVQKRVDALERERNDMLRCLFLQNEIKKFEAIKISGELLNTQSKIRELSSTLDAVRGKVENSRQLREQLRTKRREIEAEWRNLSSDMIEESGVQLLQVQVKTGDIKAQLTELATRIRAGNTSLEGLKKIKENSEEKLGSIQGEINENRKELRRLTRKNATISNELTRQQKEYTAVSEEAAHIRSNLHKNSKKSREVERQLAKLTQARIVLQTEQIKTQTKIVSLSNQLNALKTRVDKFTSTLNALKTSYADLRIVQKDQITRSKNLERSLDRRNLQKASITKEIAQAERIAESAREAVVEFVTQRELAERVAIEENALRNIEELSEMGVISGIHGRLKNLIKMQKGYERAIEAAAAGWLDSLVVQNVDVAFTCAETLKRLKLGRIKIIPLEELSSLQHITLPHLKGVSGPASTLINYEKRHEPAVIFVFGDTLVTREEKTAFLSSSRGHRTVTLNGDLYEAGGGFESGYYRAPVDFSSIIPSESAVKNLDEAVQALQLHLETRKSDVSTFDEEIETTKLEITRLAEAIATLEGEIARVRRSVKQTRRNIRRLDRRTQTCDNRLQLEKARRSHQSEQRRGLEKEIKNVQNELTELKRKTDPLQIQELELQRERLGDAIVGLRRDLGTIETNIATRKSTSENVFKIGADNIRIQLRKVKWQISTVEKEVQDALQQQERLETALSELEKTKESLTSTVINAKEESKRFVIEIDNIDKKLQNLDAIYERSDQLFNELNLNLQTAELQQNQLRQRLRELGYETSLQIAPDEFETVESSLRMLRFELERLGAINQLALTNYDTQASRYKELSVRMNELEGEKKAILTFMDEIERKKRAVFMETFNKVNDRFSGYFSKLTDGGEAALKLENPEDPFMGGIDMIVQFPGKPPILVSGASSGERSVAAVAFIFAMQEFTPASFYLCDEIDAHLDAVHVSRLGELLAEEAAKSQFLVITLKPEMVTKAQKVYGVYEQNGISHVVSPSFKEGV